MVCQVYQGLIRTKPTLLRDLNISNITSQGGHLLRMPKCHFDLALYSRLELGVDVESWRFTVGFLDLDKLGDLAPGGGVPDIGMIG